MRTFTQKLAFLLVTLLCIAGVQLKAEELNVLEDATSTTSYVPVYGLWADSPQHTQCIYSSDLLEEMEDGNITSMKFYINSASSKSSWRTGGGTFIVSLAITSESDLSSAWAPDELTEVYSGVFDASGTELEITFDNPFEYTGGNLLIDFQLPSAASDYESANFYCASQAASVSSYCYGTTGCSGSPINSLPKVTFEYEPGASGGPVCEKPSSLVASDITPKGATLTWEGNAPFNVEYKAADDADWIPLLSNTSLLTTSLSTLAPNTSYQVRVQSVCADTVSGWKSANFKTAAGIPFSEGFSSTPEGWTKHSGLLADVLAGTASLASGSNWNFGTSNSVFDKHAYINIYGTSRRDWLVTPAILIDKENVQLTFDLALTAYSGSGAAAPAVDDTLAVLASNDGGVTWTVLRLWDNAGSPDVYNNIATAGEEVIIDLSAYYGDSVRIAFYGQSTRSNGDNNLHIDNVLINKAPTCFKPIDLLINSVAKNAAEIAWTAVSEESAWKLQYKKSSASAWTTYSAIITENPFTLTGLDAFTTYDVRVAAVCDADDAEEGTSAYSQPLSFQTAAGVPFVENFNSNSLPAGWSRYSGQYDIVLSDPDSLVAVSTGWATSSTRNGVFPDSTYHLKLNLYGESVKHWIVSPSIEMQANQQLSFDLALTKSTGELSPVTPGEQDDDQFYVLLTTDNGASWEELLVWNANNTPVENIACTANGQTVVIDLSSYASDNIRIAFYGESSDANAAGDNYLHIANLHIADIPACAKPLELAVSEITAQTATFSWEAAEADSWILQYSKNANFTDSVEVAVNEASYSAAALTPETKYYVRVKAVCGGNAESEWSTSLSFIPTNSLSVTLFDGTVTNQYVPVYGYYVDDYSRSQFIIPEAELISLQWDTITKLTFYANTSSINWGAASFDVYMAIVSDATLASLADWSGMTKVLSSANLYVEDGQMVVTLDAPYQYQGGNLLIGFNQIVSGAYATSNWYGQTAAGASLGGYGTSVAQQDFLPKTQITYLPGEEPACYRPANLTVIADSITTTSALLSWERQGTESDWLIRYKKSADSEWTELDAPVQTNPYRLTGLEHSTLYNVQVAAWCDPSDSATISDYVDPISFETECATFNAFPWRENFDGVSAVVADGRVLPTCWGAINTSTSEDYGIYPSLLEAPAAAFSKPNVLVFYSYYGSSSSTYDPQDQYAILPEIEGISGLRLRLSARRNGASYDATFIVGVMSDPEDVSTFVAIDTISPATTNYEQYSVLLDSYTGAGKYIAIKLPAASTTTSYSYRTVLIDNIIVDEIPTCFEPDSLRATVDMTSGTSALLEWAAGGASAWKVQYSANESFADSVELDAVIPSANLTGLITGKKYYARVKTVCGAGDESDWSNPVSFVPVKAVVINEGTATNVYVPVYGYYVDDYSRSQFIIPASTLEELQWDSITGLTFFSSSSTVSWGPAQFEVYFAEVPSTTIATYADWASLDKVKSAGSLSIAGGEMALNLDAPYYYEGGNLLIGFKQTNSGAYANINWYGKTATGASIAGYSSTASSNGSASQQNFLPKMQIAYVEGQAPACVKPSDIEISDRTASSAVIRWTAGDEAQDAWQIAIDTLASFNPDTADLIDVADSAVYAISGLEAEHTYYLYVRANCGAVDGFSAWSKIASFATTSACEKPTGVKVGETTTTSASISWTTYGLDAFQLRYRLQGTSAWLDTIEGACPIVINGLEPATSYQVQVKAACDPSTAGSAWTTAVAFTTDCEALTTFPWSENFDGISGSGSSHKLPVCWDYINTSTYSGYSYYPTTYPNGSYSSSYYAQSAPNSLRFYSYYSSSSDYDAQDQYAVLPEMEGLNALRIRLSARAYSTGAGYDATFTVGIMSDPADTATFVPLATKVPATTSYEEYLISLDSYTGSGKYIAIKMAAADSAHTTRGLYIDDITVDSIPSCFEVSEIKISGRTANSAVIGWTNGTEDQSAWQIALGNAADFDPDDVNLSLIDADANPYTLTGLNADTTYYLYIRANCGNGDFSAWSRKASFNTAKECQMPDDLKADSIKLASVQISGYGYGHTNFNLRYGKGTAWSDTIANITLPYVLEGLEQGSTYQVQLQPVCASTEWSSSLIFTTAYGIPFVEKFDASSQPANWNTYSGELKADGTATLSSSSVWSFGSSNSVFDSHARSNIYGSGYYRWLTTPAINLSDSAVLNFDLALTTFSGSARPTPGQQADDKFIVLISTDNGAHWAILREWNNSGSEFVYDSITNAADGQPVEIDLKAYTGQSAIIAFYGESTVSGGDNNIHVDNVSIDIMRNCAKPTGLALRSVSSDNAVLAWDSEEGDAWQYYVALANAAFDESLFIDIDTNVVTLDSLAEMTSYIFYLRRDCEAEKSAVVSLSFTTIQLPAGIPFADDFENGNTWLLINGSQVNAWAYGEAAYNGTGSHALYISNDGGVTNAYTNNSASTVYASKAIEIEETGKYIFQYDWRAYGEGSSIPWDFMRVALAPASAELTAGVSIANIKESLPAGWIALDGGALKLSSQWSTENVTETVEAGLYKIVIAWQNDGSAGTNPPAAIDNFSIVQKVCGQPSAVAASNITPRSATLSWTNGDEAQSAWQIAISTEENFDPSAVVAIEAASNPYELANLNAESNYYVYVRAICGSDDYSAWSPVYSFTTLAECVINGETIDETLCLGESYTWHGQVYTEAGTYIDTLISVAGCDSITQLVLSFYAAEDTIYDATTIALGELPFTYENTAHPYIAGQEAISYAAGTQVGEYKDTVYVVGEHCTAVLIHTLTITGCEVQAEAEEISLCPGEGHMWHGKIYGEAGTYHDTIHSAIGCDTIETLVLSIFKEDTIFVTSRINVDSLPFNYVNAEHPYIIDQEPISYPVGTEVGEYKDTVLVEGEHCTAVLVHTLIVTNAQGLENIYDLDRNGTYKVLYHDILYIITNGEWYNAEGKKIADPRE